MDRTKVRVTLQKSRAGPGLAHEVGMLPQE